MKRLIYIFISLSLVIFSCQKSPYASFSVDNQNPEVGQTVFFYNNSSHGEHYEWDFGDGYVSNESNPVHTYTETGSFDVILTVTANGRDDQSTITINVQVPTLLVVEVREYYSDNLIPNASILLYPTLADWDAQTNSIAEAITDQNGVAVFSNLDPYVYYLDVWHQNYDNYQLASEDAGFITTPTVLTHSITSFIAYVDVANHSSGRVHSPMVIKKLGRRSIDKTLIPSFSGTQDWQKFFPKAK